MLQVHAKKARNRVANLETEKAQLLLANSEMSEVWDNYQEHVIASGRYAFSRLEQVNPVDMLLHRKGSCS